jgi:hypothetical protein
MPPRLIANAIVILHFAFILWVMFGAFTLFLRRWFACVHLPALAWAAYIEFSGHICPLTPVENALRRLAGGPGYRGGFIQHYILNLIYPAGLTRNVQIALGVMLVAGNALIYLIAFGRRRPAARDRSRLRSP